MVLLKKLGFRQDGVLRSWVRCLDVQQDQACFTLLRSEYEISRTGDEPV
jgi:RimJ/RimL family protein N-acetyltransferase